MEPCAGQAAGRSPVSASEVLGSQDVETPERLLLARLRRGEPEAFEALVREHQDRLYDFCVRMLADPEEAYDVVQEVFVSAHQHLARFREDSKLSTWLFRSGKNHCLNRLNYLKRRGRGRSDEYGEQSEGAEDAGPEKIASPLRLQMDDQHPACGKR